MNFDRGTLVIMVEPERPEALITHLRAAVAEDAVQIVPITTGLALSGVDLGSSNFVPVLLPRIALLAGAGASGTDAGAIWHLLDQRMQIPVTLLDPQFIGRTDLSSFNVMIMAGGSFPSIDSVGRASMIEWTGQGNTLIATEQATEWAIQHRLATASLKRAAPRKDSALAIPYALEEVHRNARAMPGAIVEAVVDVTHPLLFGYRSTTVSWFKSSALVFEPSKTPFAQPVRLGARPLISGYVHPEVLKNLSGGGLAVISPVRAGRSILLSESPAFRGYWYGTNKVLMNAIFFGPVIRSSSFRSEE